MFEVEFWGQDGFGDYDVRNVSWASSCSKFFRQSLDTFKKMSPNHPRSSSSSKNFQKHPKSIKFVATHFNIIPIRNPFKLNDILKIFLLNNFVLTRQKLQHFHQAVNFANGNP